MDNKEILNLITSSEYKSNEEIRTYAKACVKLNIFKYVDGHLTINMKTMFDVVNHIIQGNDPEILSYIRKYFTGSTRILGGLLTHIKFNRDWRKLQSEWGKMAPYLKVFTNGMYFPFNEDLLETYQELIEEYFNDALLLDASFRAVMQRFKEIPHADILKAIREELSVAE